MYRPLILSHSFDVVKSDLRFKEIIASNKNIVEEIFGKNGLIAKHHKDYEHRLGQIKMAEAVLRAFEEKKHLDFFF